MSLHYFFEDEKADGPFTILTVCTGNICRSPLVEMLLRKVLHGLPVVVHSAGTQALVGRPMTEQNCIIAEELGVQQVDDHRARLLKTDYLREADLVLVLTREHRAAVGATPSQFVVASAAEPECAGVRTRTFDGAALGAPGGCVDVADAGGGNTAVAGSDTELYLWAGTAFLRSADAGGSWS